MAVKVLNLHTSEFILQAWLADGTAWKAHHLAVRSLCPDLKKKLLSKLEFPTSGSAFLLLLRQHLETHVKARPTDSSSSLFPSEEGSFHSATLELPTGKTLSLQVHARMRVHTSPPLHSNSPSHLHFSQLSLVHTPTFPPNCPSSLSLFLAHTHLSRQGPSSSINTFSPGAGYTAFSHNTGRSLGRGVGPGGLRSKALHAPYRTLWASLFQLRNLVNQYRVSFLKLLS